MRRASLLLVLLAVLTACGDDTVALPEGLTFRVEQARQDLQGRHVELQVVNGGTAEVTVQHVDFTSGRLDQPATYDGPATVAPGSTVNLTMTMPRAACGDGLDAEVRVRYSVGDRETVTSSTRPGDHYGSVESFMARDCAESSIKDIAIGDHFAVEGSGRRSRLVVPVTFTPRDARTVHLDSVGGSTLLAPATGTSTSIDHDLTPGSRPFRTELPFVPNRCDPHVVAEDRTGGIVPLEVQSPAFGRSRVYLRFTEDQKRQIFDFLATACRFDEARGIDDATQ